MRTQCIPDIERVPNPDERFDDSFNDMSVDPMVQAQPDHSRARTRRNNRRALGKVRTLGDVVREKILKGQLQ